MTVTVLSVGRGNRRCSVLSIKAKDILRKLFVLFMRFEGQDGLYREFDEVLTSY